MNNIYKKQGNYNLLGPRKNGFGSLARLGQNGKYYCGQPLDVVCECCNGVRGPIEGCNCTACLRLDSELRGLSSTFLVNKEGAVCKITNIGFYCGRKVLEGVFGCDGYCGPTEWHNCRACKIFRSSTLTDEAY